MISSGVHPSDVLQVTSSSTSNENRHNDNYIRDSMIF